MYNLFTRFCDDAISIKRLLSLSASQNTVTVQSVFLPAVNNMQRFCNCCTLIDASGFKNEFLAFDSVSSPSLGISIMNPENAGWQTLDFHLITWSCIVLD